MKKTKIAVLVSGGGTNLQALIDEQNRGNIPHGEIVLVISNKEGAYALTRAAEAGIPNLVITKAACGDHILKVIIETCLLTEEEKITMCHLVTEAGADYIKTSTGFSKGGATLEDVALMKTNVGKNVLVKAAGGISGIEDAEKFIEIGASRLGTSRVVKAVKGIEGSGY